MAKGERAKLPRSLWILFLGTFVNRFGSFVTVFLVLYMLSRGYTAVQAGFAVSAYGIGSIFSSAVGGYLADRLGRRDSIVLSMFSSAVTMLLLSQVSTLPLIVLFVGLAGVTTELYRPAASALIADLTPVKSQVRTYAMYRLAINLGYAVGPAVAGFLASRSFFLLFLGDALTSIIFGLLALIALPTEMRHKQEKDVEQDRPESFFQVLLHDHRFQIFLVVSTVVAFVYFQSQSTFALQVKSLGLSDAVYGALVSLNGLIIVFLELPTSTITQRFPMRPVIALGVLLVGLGFGLTAFASTFFLLACTVAVWTLGEIVHSPVSVTYVSNLAPAHLRGHYQGTWGLTWSMGLILGPLLGTWLFSWNARWFWLICGALGIAAALLVLLIREKKEV